VRVGGEDRLRVIAEAPGHDVQRRELGILLELQGDAVAAKAALERATGSWQA
jgi:hypothetical protein